MNCTNNVSYEEDYELNGIFGEINCYFILLCDDTLR